MTRHLEESERAMQERVQRLEALRLSLEEVRPHGPWVECSMVFMALRTLEHPSVSALLGFNMSVHP